jgi:galactonate dehydratase
VAEHAQPLFNQSSNIVMIDTDAGITGIGQGGAHDTMEQCAGMLIGEDPCRIDRLWQTVLRGYFYPAGREKAHALGGLDVALWDLKAKALGVPVYELLGGPREITLNAMPLAFRTSSSDPNGNGTSLFRTI